ncbi:hypothetical protein [Aestuariivirga litoralis]|uniref:hypothetical protein n=1 Tax=Aestuariivirga litoralis TaxID=2650924 RepID=UPI0018C6292C|nr:hypothetical protein [Aestuariivirga litoralis]MBG1231291.1 hypothetical protein [Aestuariivirga litoralis]
MITKTIIASLAVAGTLTGASMLSATAASAKPHCGMGFPCGGFPMGGGMGPPHTVHPIGPIVDPIHPPHGGHGHGHGGFGIYVNLENQDYGVSCKTAKSIVRSSGFHAVKTQSCGGPVYSFTGLKHGQLFDIDVSRRGRIVSVD